MVAGLMGRCPHGEAQMQTLTVDLHFSHLLAVLVSCLASLTSVNAFSVGGMSPRGLHQLRASHF